MTKANIGCNVFCCIFASRLGGLLGARQFLGGIPSHLPPSSFHSWACGSGTKRGLGCKTGGYSAKLAHLPGYGLTPILGHSPPHNNIIPPPTPAVYQALSNLHDMILNHRFKVIHQQNIQRTVGLHTMIIVVDNVRKENSVQKSCCGEKITNIIYGPNSHTQQYI